MELIIIILKIFITGWLVTRFKPIQLITQLIPDNLFTLLFKVAIECSMCVSFWYGLILTQDFYTAALASFVMMLYEKSVGRWENKINLF